MVQIKSTFGVLLFVLLILCRCAQAEPLSAGTQVRGWTILSKNEEADRLTIAAATRYNINHLQLSHEIVHNLSEIKDGARCALVNNLIEAAHAAGINEVALWDHALYELDYYPKEFRTGPNNTIDLDIPNFGYGLRPIIARCSIAYHTRTP